MYVHILAFWDQIGAFWWPQKCRRARSLKKPEQIMWMRPTNRWQLGPNHAPQGCLKDIQGPQKGLLGPKRMLPSGLYQCCMSRAFRCNALDTPFAYSSTKFCWDPKLDQNEAFWGPWSQQKKCKSNHKSNPGAISQGRGFCTTRPELFIDESCLLMKVFC